MDIQRMISELQGQRKSLERAIEALRRLVPNAVDRVRRQRKHGGSAARDRSANITAITQGKRRLSPAARRRISEAQKRRWAAARKAA